jgi:hypothetical protein
MDPVHSELLKRVVDTYAHALTNSPEARDRLARVGVKNAALFERFKIGWSAGTLASMARGEVLERLRTLGLIDADGRDRFAGRVIVPAIDERGEVAQLAAYSLAATSEAPRVEWLFPDETPVFWNAACLKHAREVVLASDPLAAIVEIAKGLDATIAPAGPGKPLGQGAKDALQLHQPKIRLLRGAEHLRKELEILGIDVGGKKRDSGAVMIDQDANGFTVEFPRRLRIVVQGLQQDSARHLRASVKCLRAPAEGAASRSRIHLDTLDLYHARSRIAFAKTAACLLGEDPVLMEEHVAAAVGLAEDFLKERDKPAPAVIVSDSDRTEALELLRDPKLLDRVLADLAVLGFVGEESNKRVAYVASVSRKLDDPLSILVLSRSAAGKSTLADAVAALAPPEDVHRFTRLTAQTLYYQKPQALAHKLVLIEEAEGVEAAAYALRILQSARKLSLSTASGRGESKTHEVKGPVALFVTTTRTDLHEETTGRFLTLSVDESREQTRAILAAQRLRESRAPAEREKLIRIHQNAQRLLEPLPVVNPFAPKLGFPDDRLSARRDHAKYLGLIRAVAFVHQHQRNRENGAIVVALEDIALANQLAHQALGQSIDDLSPPSRRLLIEIRAWIEKRGEKDVRFSQRELRAALGWKQTHLAVHMQELIRAEYVVAHVAPPGKRTRYALDWDGRGFDGERFYRGLTDVAALGVDTTPAGAPVTITPLSVHYRGGTDSEGMGRKGTSGAAEGTSRSTKRTSEER